jgi:predicted phage-related endonuclease
MTTTKEIQKVTYEGATVSAAALSETDAALVKEYSRLTTQENEIKKAKKEIRDMLAGEVGEAEYGAVNGEVVVRFIAVNNRSVNFDKLFDAFPEAYAEVVTTSESRRLQIK